MKKIILIAMILLFLSSFISARTFATIGGISNTTTSMFDFSYLTPKDYDFYLKEVKFYEEKTGENLINPGGTISLNKSHNSFTFPSSEAKRMGLKFNVIGNSARMFVYVLPNNVPNCPEKIETSNNGVVSANYYAMLLKSDLSEKYFSEEDSVKTITACLYNKEKTKNLAKTKFTVNYYKDFPGVIFALGKSFLIKLLRPPTS